jgi:Protein of unknown function (DUF1420).
MIFFLNSLLSIILSCVLISGFYGIGRQSIFFLKNTNKNALIDSSYFVFFPIGISILSIFIYPICLFTQNLTLLYIICYLVILFGLNELIFLYKKKKFFLKNIEFNFFEFYIFLFLIFYFVLALAPITTADALDYHIGIPKYLINFNIWAFYP